MDRDAKKAERAKLASIEEAVWAARAALLRARGMAGDRSVRPGIADLQKRAEALDLALMKAIDRLQD
jgi:hypothetical protein